MTPCSTAACYVVALGLAVLATTPGCPSSPGCTRNSDCAVGSYCAAGTCATDCTAATVDEDCDPGQMCNTFGMCVGGADAGLPVDAGTDAAIDAGAVADAGPDAPPSVDAGGDASPGDAGSLPTDASSITDAGRDAGGGGDAGGSCGISSGDTVVLDGTGDLAAYPASQVVTLGAVSASSDALAITWDRDNLYLTMQSDVFTNAFAPLHVYLEPATTLGAATPSIGKEYGGLIPELPFGATHLIAVRRTSDSGTGPYNGVFRSTGSWLTRSFALDSGTHVFASADGRTLSVAVSWSALGGCPARLRLAAHVVRGTAGGEWTDTAPAAHTPWVAPGGSFYEIDLTADPAVSGWTVRP